jgi:hypothetical protein
VRQLSDPELLHHRSVRPLVLLAALWAGPPASAGPDAPRPDVQRPSQLQLEWTAPAACPSIDDLRTRLRDRLPTVDQPLSPGMAPLEVTASIGLTAQGFEARIELRNREGAGERVVSSRDCSLLTDAIVLVIAVTLDPVTTAARESRREDSPEEPSSEVSVTEEQPDDELPAATLTADPAPAPTSTPTDGELGVSIRGSGDDEDRTTTLTSTLQLGLRILGGGGFGPTNTGYASLAGSVALIGDRWRVAIDGRWAVRRSVVRDGGAGGQFDAWLVGAVGCFVSGRAKLELPVCAGVEAGQVRGQGLPTLPIVDQAAFPYVALRLAPGVTWVPIDRLAIGFVLELAAPLTRGEFVVDAIVVQRVVPVAVRGMLGIEIRLP